MAATKDTASFFENGTNVQFEYCYKLYPQVLKLKAEKRAKKPQELIRLDQWYQNDLPKLIKARGKDAHMVYDELVQTMKWKQMRDKFYPQLSYLIKVNTPRAVMQETKKAFRKLPNLEQAITALSNLKGVGPTMASALLAAAAPDSAPFMAYECLMAIPDIEGIDYTTKEYLNFVQHILTTVERLNTEAGGETPVWTAHRVELALWAHYVANDLGPEMLDEMPEPGGGVASTNGSAAGAKVSPSKPLKLADGEDTNDADDDESLGAPALNNTTATESETDNENTNPATGGDSNFVSNDSTSQGEPTNLDDNTTQTTVTTSTDDGGVDDIGTPLVSDSESNIEAPAPPAAAAKQISATPAAPVVPTAASGVAGAAAAPAQLNNHTGSGKGSAVGSNGGSNGNGTFDSLDGENSSSNNCPDEEEADEEDDDEDEEEDDVAAIADESSSSNMVGEPATAAAAKNLNTSADADSTVSSKSSCAGQKRALNCAADMAAAEDASSQPDIKKIRSD